MCAIFHNICNCVMAATPMILTCCILMDFPIQIHVNTTKMGLSIIYFKKSQEEISQLLCTAVSEIVFISANSADPDEMPHFAAFHLGLRCLPKYLLRGFQNVKG